MHAAVQRLQPDLLGMHDLLRMRTDVLSTAVLRLSAGLRLPGAGAAASTAGRSVWLSGRVRFL
jgi:hypothetical protein